jgi:hypothetical protein
MRVDNSVFKCPGSRLKSRYFVYDSMKITKNHEEKRLYAQLFESNFIEICELISIKWN